MIGFDKETAHEIAGIYNGLKSQGFTMGEITNILGLAMRQVEGPALDMELAETLGEFLRLLQIQGIGRAESLQVLLAMLKHTKKGGQ